LPEKHYVNLNHYDVYSLIYSFDGKSKKKFNGMLKKSTNECNFAIFWLSLHQKNFWYMRKTVSIIAFLLLFSTFWGCSSEEESTAVVDQQDTLPVLVTQIQQCAKLYTTEYHIHKVVTHDDVLRLKGNLLKQNFDIPLPLGERKIAIPMDATLKAYIDFSNFSDDNVERVGKTITILLPDPKIVMTSSKIDRDGIREYVALTRSHFTDQELTNYEQQGRKAILDNIPAQDMVEKARQDAARVLVPMLVEMGYEEKDIIIAFRKNLNIRQLINTNLEKK